MTTAPRELSNLMTPATLPQVYDALVRAWRTLFGTEPGHTSLVVLLAQWGEECGLGHAMHRWNIGNVKSVAGDGRSWCFFECTECLPKRDGAGDIIRHDDGRPVLEERPMLGRFRAFDSLDEGALDYLRLLHDHYKGAWPAVLKGDPVVFVHEIKKAGYFTADEKLYTSSVLSLVRQVERALSATVPTVKAAQHQLNERGFALPKKLVEDGVVGPLTRAATKAFQVSVGLPATGELDATTLEDLAARA